MSKYTCKKLYYFFVTLLVVSCSKEVPKSDNYPKDVKFSNVDGKPKDSLSFFLPSVILKDSNTYKTEIDSFLLNRVSAALFAAKEPVLFNFYQQEDVYRFLWRRSFHRPVVISLKRSPRGVWLNTKMLDVQPVYSDIGYLKFMPPPDPIGNSKIELIKSEEIYKKATIVYDQTMRLSVKEWNEFEGLLSDFSFWTAKPSIQEDGLDGAEWLIEGHLRDKYWFVSRRSPHDEFRNAGEYLIKKSGLKERVY